MSKTVNKRAPLLFSYRMTHDTGLAPNPYGDECTLALCKPVIRRVAKVGDWITGTFTDKDVTKVIYAMKVENIMSFEEYDQYCRDNKGMMVKIPDWGSGEHNKMVGDCIYDYSAADDKYGIPAQRMSIHNHSNRETNLNGENVLLSKHFYYFGNGAPELHRDLKKIIKNGQGHRSTSNSALMPQFISWIEGVGKKCGRHGEPIHKHIDEKTLKDCSTCHAKEGKEDLKIRKNTIC